MSEANTFADYKILIIDDMADARTALKEMLGLLGFFVNEAEDGYQGWKRMEEVLPDLIFLDINMPRIDGISFLDKKKKSVYNDIPVIMTTSENSLSHVKSAKEKGATEYIVKPVELENLKEKLILVLDISF